MCDRRTEVKNAGRRGKVITDAKKSEKNVTKEKNKSIVHQSSKLVQGNHANKNWLLGSHTTDTNVGKVDYNRRPWNKFFC